MDAVARNQPALRTPRLRLREFRADDAAGLYAVHSDPRVMRYWSFPAWTRMEQAHARVATILDERARGAVFVWAVADAGSDQLIGSIAAFSVDRAQARAEVGYSLHADWHGRGLASEALGAVLAFLIDDLGLERIEADIDPRNAASCRLAERLGFVREGLLRERWRVNGETCDTALYGLLAREFVRASPASCGSGGSRETLGTKSTRGGKSFPASAAPTSAAEPSA
jgi:RimJ/RimL family protein N-acetyltransferase